MFTEKAKKAHAAETKLLLISETAAITCQVVVKENGEWDTNGIWNKDNAEAWLTEIQLPVKMQVHMAHSGKRVGVEAMRSGCRRKKV